MEESDKRLHHQQPLIPDQFNQNFVANQNNARNLNQVAASGGQQAYDPDFIRQRAKQVVVNRQDINFSFPGKSALKEGYDLTRLVSPSID